MPLQNGPVRDVVMDVSQDGGRRSWVELSRTFKKLPPTDEVVCIVEVQELDPEGLSNSVGWSVIPIFNKDHAVLSGSWRVPLMQPPVKLSLTSPAAYACGDSFDVLQCLPRVMVETFDAESFDAFHGPGKVSNKVEATLYLRLHPCDPAPVPEDLDYEQKMAEAAMKADNIWPDAPPLSDYKEAGIFRVSTPEFIRRPYTPPLPSSHDQTANDATPGHSPRIPVVLPPGGVANKSQVTAEGGVGGQLERRKDAVHVGGGLALAKEAWTEMVSEIGVGAGTGVDGGPGIDARLTHRSVMGDKGLNKGVSCGPDEELLIILDGARFLPDNVSLAYATLAMVRPDGSSVNIATTSAKHAFGVPNTRAHGVADLEASLHSPTFQLSCSFRLRDCDPSSWIVVRIDALDHHLPPGSLPVCVGLACFSVFKQISNGQALGDEQAEQYMAAITLAETEARRQHLDHLAAQDLLPKIAIVKGGWQIPIRSVWPLRALWRKGGRGVDDIHASPAALAALSRFVGEPVSEHMGRGGKIKPISAAAKNVVRPATVGPATLLAGGSLHLIQARQLVGVGLQSVPISSATAGVGKKGVNGGGEGWGGGREVTEKLAKMSPVLIEALPRLPCATLLLRIIVNPTEEDMMTVLSHAGHTSLLDEIQRRQRDLARDLHTEVEAGVDEEEAALRKEELIMRAAIVRTKPQYSKGFYNSLACVPSGVERAMLPHKLASVRRDLSGKDVLRHLLSEQFQGFDDEQYQADDEQHQARILTAATNLFLDSSFFGAARSGSGSGHGGGGAVGGEEGGDGSGAGNMQRALVGGALDLAFMCGYLPAIGFQVAIDGAVNLPVIKGQGAERVWPVAVAGVLPASSYFAADAHGILTAHTWFLSNLHPSSTLKCVCVCVCVFVWVCAQLSFVALFCRSLWYLSFCTSLLLFRTSLLQLAFTLWLFGSNLLQVSFALLYVSLALLQIFREGALVLTNLDDDLSFF